MDKSRFAESHPVVIFVYILGGLLVTMFTMRPELLLISCLIAALYATWLAGPKIWKMFIGMFLPVAIFMIVVLPFFSHSGSTPLFYVNDMAVTKENVIYGAVMSVLLLAIFIWFFVAGRFFDSERLLYMFGRILPTMGLMISMIFRTLPLMRKRYREIAEAQRGIGRKSENMGIVERCHLVMKKISILISWTLESSIETSISMESRGYGTGRRTNFHLFKFHKQDAMWLVLFTISYGFVIYVIGAGYFKVSYFPEIIFRKTGLWEIIAYMVFMIAGLAPFAYDLGGKINGK